MKLLRYILLPAVPIYYGVTLLRNKLYDLDIKKSKHYNFPVICVGNLSVGGTGKTPMIEYLIRTLKADYKLATLSRGYKRKTKGFVIANNATKVEDIGDEPFQFYTKFKNEITVAVDADRQNGIENLRQLNPQPEVILLDDAYQHRKVKAGFNILLTPYYNLYANDIVLPTGDLREPRQGANRANVIVVTKCPQNLNDDKKKNIIKRLKPNSNQTVFFSRIAYSKQVFSKTEEKPLAHLPKFTLVTGIADATPLVNFLNENALNFEHLEYTDHYNFTAEDIKTLSTKDVILTTEKDYMRLKQYSLLKDKLFYIPIRFVIDRDTEFKTELDVFLQSF